MSGAPLAPEKLDAFARLPRGQLHSEGSVNLASIPFLSVPALLTLGGGREDVVVGGRGREFCGG